VKGQLIRAYYDYDCVWNEWSDPVQFARKDKDDDVEYVFGEPLENGGFKYVRHEIRGSNEALQEIADMVEQKILIMESEK